MSETEKTPQYYQNEYTKLCVKAGSLQYQIFALTKDLEQVNAAQRDINIEAAKTAQAAKEAAKPAEETKETPNA